MSVCALVLEAGGNEDLAIAALLHDAVEDQGGEPTRATIERLFGEDVARIVSECSDTDVEPKPPWRERKERYLKHFETASPAAILISVADKLHNARAILADYRAVGDRVWDRFKAPKEDQLWYYGALLNEFRKCNKCALVDEFERVFAELNRVCRGHSG